MRQASSSKNWRYFEFFDNGQPCYARIEEKDYSELEKRDQGKQIQYTFFSSNEQQRFGPRFKKLNNDVIKMRFTGPLSGARIFFEREKMPYNLANEGPQRNPDINSQESSNPVIFTVTRFTTKH